MSVVPAGHLRRDVEELNCGATLITMHGVQQGPTLALLGGVHGDENEGVLAVHRILVELATRRLAGTVKAVAPANPAAWAARSRTTSSDGADLARCFPGSYDGGPTTVLAAELTERVINGADLLIDLHSAGVRYDMPLFCGFSRSGATAEPSRRAARAFGAPLIWVHTGLSAGRSLSAAAHLGVPAIYAECAGGGSIRAGDLGAYVAGVLRVMGNLDMLPDSLAPRKDSHSSWVYGDGDLDQGAVAHQHGLFVSATTAGAQVDRGAEIGRLYDFEGRLIDTVCAPRAGVVMFLRRQARTHADDVLFVLAQFGEGQV